VSDDARLLDGHQPIAPEDHSSGAPLQTTVPGLFAAGDAATRELIAGATSGGGAQNSAWALSSGLWSGAGAAALARRAGRRLNEPVRPSGGIALRPTGAAKPVAILYFPYPTQYMV